MARLLVIALPTLSQYWLALLYALSILTMTLANVIALRQENVKRMLAYSSVAHAGFILLGLVAITGLGSAQPFTGLDGVLMYVLGYTITNVGAFAVVAAVEDARGSTTLDDFAGLIHHSPFLAAAMLIFLLSLAGIPPLAGFVAKLFVFAPVIRSQYYVLAVVALVNAVIAAGYYLRVVKQMFFVPGDAATSTWRLARGMEVALWACLIGVFAVFFFMNGFTTWTVDAASAMLGL